MNNKSETVQFILFMILEILVAVVIVINIGYMIYSRNNIIDTQSYSIAEVVRDIENVRYSGYNNTVECVIKRNLSDEYADVVIKELEDRESKRYIDVTDLVENNDSKKSSSSNSSKSTNTSSIIDSSIVQLDDSEWYIDSSKVDLSDDCDTVIKIRDKEYKLSEKEIETCKYLQSIGNEEYKYEIVKYSMEAYGDNNGNIFNNPYKKYGTVNVELKSDTDSIKYKAVVNKDGLIERVIGV
jgi:hypothetical protein